MPVTPQLQNTTNRGIRLVAAGAESHSNAFTVRKGTSRGSSHTIFIWVRLFQDRRFVAPRMSRDCTPKRRTQRIYHLSFLNGHLSSARCEPLACAVLLEALSIRQSRDSP